MLIIIELILYGWFRQDLKLTIQNVYMYMYIWIIWIDQKTIYFDMTVANWVEIVMIGVAHIDIDKMEPIQHNVRDEKWKGWG